MQARRALSAYVAIAALAATSGCDSCGKRAAVVPPRAPEAPPEIPPAALAETWTWRATDPSAYAMPVGCSIAGGPRLHPADTTHLLFQSAAGETNSIAVATFSDEGGMTSARGIVPVGRGVLSGAARDIPWIEATEPPTMAAAEGLWLAVLQQSDAMGPMQRLWLWREGRPMESLAQGDQLTVVDARCSGTMCAILTTRPTEVAAGGAALWTGLYGEPTRSWLRQDLANEVEGARPLSLSSYDAATGTCTVAMGTRDEILFFEATPLAVRRVGAVPRTGSLLDTVGTIAGPVALQTSGTVTGEGCVPEGATLEARMPGHDGSRTELSTMPESGYARPLGRGAIVTWISRVNCKDPRRKVVHAMLVSASGRPGAVMTVCDADGYALATSGEHAVIWLRGAAGVTELRARCVVGE